MRTISAIAIGFLFLMPAGAQEEGLKVSKERRNRQVLYYLQRSQKDAAQRLQNRMGEMQELIVDLRRRNENAKADLLQKAIQIVTDKQIGLDNTGGRPGDAQLADLRTVMLQMARTLEERPDATDEVLRLATKVVTILDRIVNTLLDQGDISSLEEREQDLSDIRDQTSRLARRQHDLKRETLRALPRTQAEKAAEAAGRDLEKLIRKLRELDRQARAGLAELDRAREWAANLQEMVQRQRRIQSETAVRAGKADKLTPRINEALAGLEQIARAAEKAAEREGQRASVSALARAVKALAARQAKLAREIADRAALERVQKALRDGRGINDRQMLQDAAKAAKGARAEALREAAAKPGDKKAQARAAKAVQEALERLPDQQALVRDQKVVAREVERALMQAPEEAKEAVRALSEARKQSTRAAAHLEARTDATRAAHAAAKALDKAAEELGKQAAARAEAALAEKQAAELERTAEQAGRLARQLSKLASEKETQDAGLAGLVEQAKRAAERAQTELKQAAEAGLKGDADRAREQATAARERSEFAQKELRESMQERHDLTRRQGKLADDLKHMSGNTAKPQDARQLQEAAQHAGKAQKSLREGEFGEAGAEQQQVLDKLQKLSDEAQAAVQAAARKQQAALSKAQQQTARAADEAKRVARQLEDAGRGAKENDSRRRMDNAQSSTAKAEEALRRSLKRLRDLMPKPAEQDRREALDHLEAAQRSLKGLREAHLNPDQRARDQLKQISGRQKRLEDDVKLLEERLKQLKERSGVQRMQDAQSAMREAQQHLDQGEPDEAERAQDRAEKSLKEAQKELDREERRYRSLRQYELLFKLKQELRRFRREAQGHRERLQRADAMVRSAGRVTRHINRRELQPLRKEIRTLERDVSDKADAIEKERAIVYTYILKGCARDLKESEGLLAMKEVGLVPQEMLGDVVRRFDLAIAGLERNLRERQDQDKQDQQNRDQKKGQQPGQTKPLLVPQDAEVRMVMVLQKALNTERENFFASRPDFGSRKPTPREKSRLVRLYHQQGSLAELFDSVRQALVGQQGEEPVEPPEGGEEEER